jgi:hypothetical protein
MFISLLSRLIGISTVLRSRSLEKDTVTEPARNLTLVGECYNHASSGDVTSGPFSELGRCWRHRSELQ